MLNYGIQNYKYKKFIYILLTFYIYDIHLKKKKNLVSQIVESSYFIFTNFHKKRNHK
jgi:hypothetical protein